MLRRLMRISIGTALLGIFALLVTGAPAHAAFPGVNGKIGFTRGQGEQEEIYSINPDGSRRSRQPHQQQHHR